MTSVNLGADPKPNYISRKISIELIGLLIQILNVNSVLTNSGVAGCKEKLMGSVLYAVISGF